MKVIMREIRSSFFLVTLCVTALCGFAYGQDLGSPSLDRIWVNGKMVEAPTRAQILAKISSVYDVRIGFVYSSTDRVPVRHRNGSGGGTYFERKPLITPRNGKLANVIREVASPGYLVEERDGLFLVFPSEGFDSAVQDFLDARVPTHELCYRPFEQMQTTLRFEKVSDGGPRKFDVAGILPVADCSFSSAKLRFPLAKMSIQSVLEFVVDKTPYKFWSLQQTSEDGSFVVHMS